MKSLVAFAAVAAAAVAAPAFAQAQTLPASLAPVTFNAGIGWTGISLPRANFGAVTFRAGADFGKYVGLEGEGSIGTADGDDMIGAVTTKVHLNNEYAGYGVVRYPVLANANLFGRVGYGHSEIRVRGTDVVSGASVSLTGGADSVNYGAGGEYFLDGKNGIRAEYTRFDFQDRGLKDADTWTVSYVHKF